VRWYSPTGITTRRNEQKALCFKEKTNNQGEERNNSGTDSLLSKTELQASRAWRHQEEMKTAALTLKEQNNTRNKTPTRPGERKKKKQQQKGLKVYVQNKQTDRRGTETQPSSASRH
jgi:hypothetical protein